MSLSKTNRHNKQNLVTNKSEGKKIYATFLKATEHTLNPGTTAIANKGFLEVKVTERRCGSCRAGFSRRSEVCAPGEKQPRPGVPPTAMGVKCQAPVKKSTPGSRGQRAAGVILRDLPFGSTVSA